MLATSGPDGVLRCPWGMTTQDYFDYHDTEWGRRTCGEQQLFERLTLEAFQSGLSWLTILRKRDNFRHAFAGFDADAVARFTATDRERLMGDAGIVRNGRKIDATITNARAILILRGSEGFEALIERFAPTQHRRPATKDELRGSSPESAALAKELKKRGFAHVGPTTIYSMFQACGYINDHVVGCQAGDALEVA